MANSVKVKSSAKINLSLDILEKTHSNYHKIDSIIQELPTLSDDIETIEAQESDNLSILNRPQKGNYPTAEENLAFKALKLLKAKTNTQKNAHIKIYKRIPLKSGLGGASSNAAATLKALNELWELKLSQENLYALASELGMDVAFFISGGTSLATNFGEVIKPLSPIKNIEFRITPPSKWATPQKKSTAQAYKSLSLSKCGKNTHKTQALLAAIKKQDASAILKNLHNDFETLYAPPGGTHLSGSGPATFTAKRKDDLPH